MFPVTLVDHLRLTFGHVVYRHRTHEHIAHSRARWSRRLRAAEALLIAGVGFTSVGVAIGKDRSFAIAAAVMAGVALAVWLVRLAVDFDGSARAHAACATQLWRMREQYRALLSDLADGALQIEEVRQRRDALMNELHAIYENAPPADQPAYEAASRAVGPADARALTDQEIDLFLPNSLHKDGKSAAA